MPRASISFDCQRLLDVLPDAPPNDGCPRVGAVEELLDLQWGRGRIEDISKGLRLHPNLRPLLCSRIRVWLTKEARSGPYRLTAKRGDTLCFAYAKIWVQICSFAFGWAL